jgi:hypothetical protein
MNTIRSVALMALTITATSAAEKDAGSDRMLSGAHK